MLIVVLVPLPLPAVRRGRLRPRRGGLLAARRHVHRRAEHAVMHLLYSRFFVKAMRDMGRFDDAAAVMRDHGRDPEGLFDEPFLTVRNQGQILGEEHVGDIVSSDGEWDGERLVASSVLVDPTAGPDAGVVVGEIMGRTENVLQVQHGERLVAVEVPESALVEIPAIPGANDVNQLKQHLEVQRMSKSRGNVVNPDELVELYGADTVRTHLMFAFEWQKGGPGTAEGSSARGASSKTCGSWAPRHTPDAVTDRRRRRCAGAPTRRFRRSATTWSTSSGTPRSLRS